MAFLANGSIRNAENIQMQTLLIFFRRSVMQCRSICFKSASTVYDKIHTVVLAFCHEKILTNKGKICRYDIRIFTRLDLNEAYERFPAISSVNQKLFRKYKSCTIFCDTSPISWHFEIKAPTNVEIFLCKICCWEIYCARFEARVQNRLKKGSKPKQQRQVELLCFLRDFENH